MKPRHAAALALVGWYLMVAPRDGELNPIKAPLSAWEQSQAFDSAKACDYAAGEANANWTSKWFAKNPGRVPDWTEDRPFANCFATNDPRLKGN